MTVRLFDTIAESKLPPSYAENPVVTGSREPVMPCNLRVGGAPCESVDSAVGFWMANVITGARHIVALE